MPDRTPPVNHAAARAGAGRPRRATTTALALAVLAGCTSHQIVDDDGAPNARALARVERRTAETRRLAFKEPVTAVVYDKEASRAYFTARARAVDDETWAREDQVAHRLGLLPDGASLARVFPRALGENAGGLYLPTDDDARREGLARRGRLFIVEDVLPAPVRVALDGLGVVTATDWSNELFLAHELTHALQDQHFDLEAVLPSALAATDADRVLARKALVESEANLVAQAYVLGVDLESDVQRNLLIEYLVFGRSLDVLFASQMSPDVPRTYTRLLVEQYTRGLRYLQMLADEGGLDAVNAAYRARLPDSTEQLLFPEKRLSGVVDAPRAVTPLPRDLMGLVRVESNTLGALGLKILLEEHDAGDGADDVVFGWGGDRYDVYDDGERTLVVLRTVWDTDDDAAEGARALSRLLDGKYPGRVTARVSDETRRIVDVAPSEGSAPARGVRTRAPEAAAVVRAGRAVVVVEGARPERLEALLAAVLAAPLVEERGAPAPAVVAARDDVIVTHPGPARAPLEERVFLPHHRLALRMGAGVTTVHDGRAPTLSLALDRELRWGFRPSLEWAPPFLVTWRAPSPSSTLVAVTAGLSGLVLGWSREHAAPSLVVRPLVLVSAAGFAWGTLGALAQGGAEGTWSSLVPGVDFDVVGSLTGLARPTSFLVVALGIGARAPPPGFTPTSSEPALVLGAAGWRGRAPIPIVEVELVDGLSLYATSEVVLGASSLALRAHRHTGGVLVVF